MCREGIILYLWLEQLIEKKSGTYGFDQTNTPKYCIHDQKIRRKRDCDEPHVLSHKIEH